jgi:hypothetical protein
MPFIYQRQSTDSFMFSLSLTRCFKSFILLGGFFSLLSGFVETPRVHAQDPRQTTIDLKKDFPVLASRMGSQSPANFVIAIDRSGSMKPFWPGVQQAVISFLEAIPDGDYLSIVAFGTGASNMVTPRPINAQTRAELIGEIRNLGDPTDSATDIGAALEKTLDELNVSTGNRLKFVFLFTDFAHEPSSQSRYHGKMSPEDKVWQTLAERRRNEQAESALQVFALLLPAGQLVGRDIQLGRVVFPELQPVPVNQATLLPWFERRKAEIGRDKLKSIVDRDSQRALLTLKAIEQRADQLVGIFELASNRIVETSFISQIRISELASGRLQTYLEPEPTEALKITVGAGAGPLVFEIPIARIRAQSAFLRWVANDQVSFKLTATQNLEPAVEIARLNLTNPREFQLAVKDKEARVRGGYLPTWALGIAVGVLLLIGIGLVRYRRSEYITGEIGVIGHGTPLSLRPSSKRQTLKVGDVGNSEGIPIKGAPWVLTFQAFNPPKHPRGIYVRMERGQATLNKKVALNNQKWESIPRDSIIEVKNGKTVTFK